MNAVAKYFEGRKLVVATMHGKEKVIGPVLEQQLGVIVVPAEELNTDVFGTFSGEIERKDDPLATARLKCRKVHELSGGMLVVASEGSFGPHPVIGFIPADDEILVLTDFERNIEIKVRELSTETNFAGRRCDDYRALSAFAKEVGFPQHAIILRDAKDSHQHIVKGISNYADLEKAHQEIYTKYGSVFAETDMRAMHNPMRMQVIEKAAHKLAQKAMQLCPVCTTPGYDVYDVISGLPCDWCGLPTNGTLAHIYKCESCNHTEEKKHPNGRQKEDPMFCNNCNP
ncbi:hypothetical protein CAP35_13435 [Chitinophagaceae bacterium IBVUCB1]|nr:hypothetical protein CAP35_13435 [Chitinophagaceae bacterium IBVUCB1]